MQNIHSTSIFLNKLKSNIIHDLCYILWATLVYTVPENAIFTYWVSNGNTGERERKETQSFFSPIALNENAFSPAARKEEEGIKTRLFLRSMLVGDGHLYLQCNKVYWHKPNLWHLEKQTFMKMHDDDIRNGISPR